MMKLKSILAASLREPRHGFFGEGSSMALGTSSLSGLLLILAADFAPGIASAEVFQFSFDSGPANTNTIQTDGTVTGLIFGLVANGNNQTSVSVEITSSPLTLVTSSLAYEGGGGFDVTDGQITGANNVNFYGDTNSGSNYPFGTFMVFNGNGSSANLLFNYTTDQTVVNLNGFAGINYTQVSPVPVPSTWAMMILGIAGVGFAAYRRKVKPASVAA